MQRIHLLLPIVYICVEFGLECLASWKEDSHTYFYARLPGLGDEEYRCFVSILMHFINLSQLFDDK